MESVKVNKNHELYPGNLFDFRFLLIPGRRRKARCLQDVWKATSKMSFLHKKQDSS